ncbi:hypothetical protein KY348_02140 [Candidatus Woesearchaeota archaeon]|nr:hypothetical protein [Candidatus Woesearchaeota archaeon]
MEIKIDTKKDSAEDIRKAIELLQRIVETSRGGYGSEISPTGEVSSGMAGLFGDEPVLGAPPGNDDESKDEEEEGNIEIVPY